MKILGLPIPFTAEKQKATDAGLMSLPYTSGYFGSYPIVWESFPGAWQRDTPIRNDVAQAFHADFACKTLIARDVAKLRVKLVEKDADTEIWTETTNPAYSPVLRRPNEYQTRNQFFENWMLSKLSRGNAYVLKVRDARNVVTDLHVLDPVRVVPLISEDGSIFYRLMTDYLAGVTEITVPARDIIHDRCNCLFHPLVGTPPIFASGLASMLGINAQKASNLLFENSSTPGGILTTPNNIDQVQEERIKEQWEQRFSKVNLGRVAVLSGGMTYQRLPMTNVEVQLLENLKWSAQVVCSVYHVPGYKVSVEPLPSHINIQSLNCEYYAQALQSHIEEIEELLDYALGIGEADGLGTQFDTDNLLRMDTATLVTTIKDAVGAGVMAPNEGRSKFDLPPVTGGESPYLQQQNFSLEALAKRDAQADPFAPAAPPKPPPGAAPADAPPKPDAQKLAAITQKFTEALRAA